jgi:hypothetical protein
MIAGARGPRAVILAALVLGSAGVTAALAWRGRDTAAPAVSCSSCDARHQSHLRLIETRTKEATR